MAIRISTALRNFLLSKGSLAQAFNGGILDVYTGPQPATADAAPTGTRLVTFTNASGTWTQETPATGTITLTGGSSGSIDTVTVGGKNILDAAVSYDTSLSVTATALAAALNRSALNNDFDAAASGAVVTLTSRPGRAVQYNSVALSATLTTITASYANFASGVASVNGLLFDVADSGILVKRQTQVWTGVAVASGAAGWFRLKGPTLDDNLAGTTMLRLDGSIATSGGNLTMNPTSMTLGGTQTLASFSPTIPAEY